MLDQSNDKRDDGGTKQYFVDKVIKVLQDQFANSLDMWSWELVLAESIGIKIKIRLN